MTGWSKFFNAAGAWNLAIAALLMGEPENGTIVRAIFAAYGLAYLKVAQDPVKYRYLAVQGLIGKLLVVLSYLRDPLSVQVPGETSAEVLVLGDFLFGLGFAYFLYGRKQ